MNSTVFDRIAKNLVDIGAISLDDYLAGHSPAPQFQFAPHPLASEAISEGNAVTQLHQACQRAFRNTDPLKFEFIEHAGSGDKQCILTITKPDGMRRSYTTQPIFAKKNEAKLEAARIAIDMGVLDFLVGGDGQLLRPSVETSNADNTDAMSVQDNFVDDIEKCCLEWRAGRVTPHWVPFFDPKSPYKQGCALRIQLSPHVSRIYLSDPAFDTHSGAKGACAKAAISEGVLDFIKFGNGQTHPSSPASSTSSTSQSTPVASTTPYTLQAFYDSLPRPFPESFQNSSPSEFNPLGWMNSMTQNARGGRLILSFFFTSDGPPGLHGCLLKLDRPGEYKAFLVDARFPKRSDAKAAVCLQAMSEGIGDYIRSIASAVENKVTPTMRSFSSSVVYPALTSALSKIDTDFHPYFEYVKERDAFGATLIVRLSTLPTSDPVRRYNVPSEYRSKADAKAAVICRAAEQGVIEFVRFRGGPPPDGYVSLYSLHTYDPEASRKRKQSGSVEDAEQSQPAKKKKKKGKQRTGAAAQGEISRLTPIGQYLSVHLSSDQVHGISGPGDMGLSQSVRMDGLCDPSQPGVGGGGGSGAARPAMYGQGMLHNGKMFTSSYPAVLDPRLRVGALVSHGYGFHPPPGVYGDQSYAVGPPPSESGPSRAQPGSSSRTPRRPSEDGELEPGEVVSSAESEFSVSSSRNEDVDVEVPMNEQEVNPDLKERESVEALDAPGSSGDKGKAKDISPVNTSTTVSRDDSGPGPGAMTTATATVSHVKNLIDFCARHHCGTPSFHELQSQGRFQVWIVIGNERFDLPTTYGTAEEGRQRVAKQVLVWLSKGLSG